MREDSIVVDSLEIRPLPKWLTDRKEGLTTYKPRQIIIKEDNSLRNSIIVTGLVVVLVVVVLSIYIKGINKRKSG